MNKTYKQRINLSKARLENDMREAAEECKGMGFDEAREFINRKCHTSIDPEFLRELLS